LHWWNGVNSFAGVADGGQLHTGLVTIVTPPRPDPRPPARRFRVAPVRVSVETRAQFRIPRNQPAVPRMEVCLNHRVVDVPCDLVGRPPHAPPEVRHVAGEIVDRLDSA